MDSKNQGFTYDAIASLVYNSAESILYTQLSDGSIRQYDDISETEYLILLRRDKYFLENFLKFHIEHEVLQESYKYKDSL